MELAVHSHKNGRQKLNVNHLGNLARVEKELEDMYNFMSKSGKINIAQLHSARSSHRKESDK